jgi:hypothetical protein
MSACGGVPLRNQRPLRPVRIPAVVGGPPGSVLLQPQRKELRASRAARAVRRSASSRSGRCAGWRGGTSSGPPSARTGGRLATLPADSRSIRRRRTSGIRSRRPPALVFACVPPETVGDFGRRMPSSSAVAAASTPTSRRRASAWRRRSDGRVDLLDWPASAASPRRCP